MQNWRVGPVQTVSGGSFWGSGFVLYDETGKPCVTFGYFSESDLREAMALLRRCECVPISALGTSGPERFLSSPRMGCASLDVLAQNPPKRDGDH